MTGLIEQAASAINRLSPADMGGDGSEGIWKQQFFGRVTGDGDVVQNVRY